MILERLEQYSGGDRAVSPVIGVILMVAITVILAAVIGAFVMGISGGNASAPNANLDVSQDTYTVETRDSPSWLEVADTYEDVVHVKVRHAGGETMNQQNIQLRSDIELDDYTDGNVTDQLGWLAGLNRSRADTDQTDYTAGLWNNREQKSIESPETTRYSWWINDDPDKVVYDTGGDGWHWDSVTYRTVYTRSDVRCRVRAFGNPRMGYEENSGNDLADEYAIWFDQDTAQTNECPGTSGDNRIRLLWDQNDHVGAWGRVGVGDVNRVIWSPPDVDQSQTLAEYEIR